MASPPEPARPPEGAGVASRAPGRSLAARLVVLVVAAAACALGAWLGAWWVPFVVGVGTGILRKTVTRLPRGLLWPAVAGAVLGWVIPIWVLALRGQPAGATARVIAALAGLPPYAGVAIVVTLLLAALQVLAGAWLARALIPRRPVAALPDRSPGPPDAAIGQG